MRCLLLCTWVLLSCAKKNEEPKVLPAAAKKAVGPEVVEVPGALHAVKCGEVTAVFGGEKQEPGIPVSYGVESLAFLIGGEELPFKPLGTVAGPHRALNVFSARCESVFLQHDSYGPIWVLPVSALGPHLKGKDTKVWDVRAPNDGGTAQLHHDPVWREDGTLEFQASCCGGVEVFAAKEGNTERIAFFASAPSGVSRRPDGGYSLGP